MGQGFFVLKHRAEIAHVEITAAGFAFPKMFSLAQRVLGGALKLGGRLHQPSRPAPVAHPANGPEWVLPILCPRTEVRKS